jgi:G3E family GTPase
VKLLCVAGFLGSGKTTLLLDLARRMTAASLRLAIVENEIGAIGVDGGFVREAGLPVRELFGGCICCTLQTGLVATLRAIAAEYDPDWVIVEPTGLAAPGDITTSVRALLPHIDHIRVVTLVDAERWEMLSQVVEPLITAQIAAADVIAVNKVDTVDGEVLAAVTAAVRRSNAAAPIIPVAAATGAGVQALYEALLA